MRKDHVLKRLSFFSSSPKIKKSRMVRARVVGGGSVKMWGVIKEGVTWFN